MNIVSLFSHSLSAPQKRLLSPLCLESVYPAVINKEDRLGMGKVPRRISGGEIKPQAHL